MNDTLYRLVFSGQIVKGADIDEVKAKVVKILGIDSTEVDELFSGGNKIIKKNSPLEVCAKAKEAFEEAGAVCRIEKEGISKPPPLPNLQGKKDIASQTLHRERRADEKFCSSCGAIIQIKELACPYCGMKQKKEGMGCVPIAAIGIAIVVLGFFVLGILAAIAIPQFAAYRQRAYEASIKTELRNLSVSEEVYYREHSRYTTDLHDLGFQVADAKVIVEVITADEDCFNARGLMREAKKIIWIDCQGDMTEELPEQHLRD